MTTTLISTKTLPDTLDVYVDQEDLQLGKRFDATYCAVARAIKRTLVLQGHEGHWARVKHEYADIAAGDEIRRYDHDARDLIVDFDSGENPPPRLVHLTSQER